MMMWAQYQKKRDNMGVGQGAQATKGVGGYRPTINWREIAVRRRSVAARQVLACIIVCGVVIVAVGILLTVLGFLVIASQCPFMWKSGAGSCYYLAPHNATWDEGRAYCTSQSAALLHLHSGAEADFINGLMAGRSWLGARRRRGREGVWAWEDSDIALNYTRWPSSVPASLTQDLCAAVEPGGRWVALECRGNETAYVICDYIPGYNPFMLVGPVVAVCGVVVLALSVEVCMRRREFIVKNPEAAITDDQDDERQVDAGIINYGYGHFGGEEEDPARQPSLLTLAKPQQEPTTPSSQHAPGTSAPWVQKLVVSPRTGVENSVVEEEEHKDEEDKEEEERNENEEEGERAEVEVPGPKVHVVPASPSSLTPPSIEENTPSQEHLELLLSPKTLE